MGKLKRKISELDGFSTENHSKEHVTNDKLLNLKQKFVDNFIYDFTQEELAAKHTLETIFKKSHSFGYTYKCIQSALDLDPMQIGYFVKAIAAVADLELIKLNQSHHVFDSLDSPQHGKLRSNDSPTDYEMESHTNSDLFSQKDQTLYDLFDNILSKLIQNIHIPMETDGKYGINDVDWYVNLLEYGFLSRLLPFGYEFIRNLIEISKSNNSNLTRFNQLSNVLIYTLQRGQSITSYWITRILNKSETSGTSLFEPNEIDWQELNNRNCIDLLIKLFDYGEAIHNEIQNFDIAKDKLKRLEKLESENIEYKRKLDSERAKKMSAKRNAVNFILERKSEYDSFPQSSKMKHPFYIIGQDVKNSSISSLKKLSKRLKSLLHPDTETDLVWKEKCERSFKEASSALDLCMIWIKNPTKLAFCNNGPIVDFFQNDFTSSTINKNDSPNLFTVNYMIIPEFTIECIDTKIGSLQITVDINSCQKVFTGNLFFNVFVHRPIHGDEPIALIPNIDRLSFWKKVDIISSSCYHTTGINAIQPISLGGMKKYFIGVQIGGRNGTSLIKWKSIYIELDKKGRSLKQIEMLLETFEGAPFISNDHVNKINTIKGNKIMMEKYLNECIESAQRWANKI